MRITRVTRTYTRVLACAIEKSPSNIIGWEVEGCHEKAFGGAARSRDSFHRPIIGDACVRVRRLRSELPSQWVGPMRMGRPKSRLVYGGDGPSRRSYARWDDALF